MSFLIDIPLLVGSGIILYLLGRRMERLARIMMGAGIVFVFIAFSSLLYLDWIRCTVPGCDNLSGSDFMFKTNWQ